MCLDFSLGPSDTPESPINVSTGSICAGFLPACTEMLLVTSSTGRVLLYDLKSSASLSSEIWEQIGRWRERQ